MQKHQCGSHGCQLSALLIQISVPSPFYRLHALPLVIKHLCDVTQEEYDALDSRLKVQSAAAENAKQDSQQRHLEMQTQIQKLQQQLKDLASEHQQLKDKHESLQSVSASISQPAARPSMLGGVKAMLQKLNGSQQQQRQLPVSVPSLVNGQHLGVDTPTHSAHTAFSSTAAFKPDSRVILQQPQGHFSALEGTPLQPVTQNAEVAESSGQQEDDWDVLLRCASNASWFTMLLQLPCCYMFVCLLHVAQNAYALPVFVKRMGCAIIFVSMVIATAKNCSLYSCHDKRHH